MAIVNARELTGAAHGHAIFPTRGTVMLNGFVDIHCISASIKKRRLPIK
jgi:hypothetical protein